MFLKKWTLNVGFQGKQVLAPWKIWYNMHFLLVIAHSVRAVKYTDCISAKYPEYDIKQSDGEAPVMLELRVMQSTPLLPSLPGPLLPRVVIPDRVLFMGQIELNSVCMLNWIVWNRTVCIKMDLALNNL